jgi:atypical dual specificity phosphatase
MVRTSRKVPTEWHKYEAVGEVIPNTRIFAFKTPLNVELQKRFHKSAHFTTIHLFRQMAEQGKTLGMVIDLTNTDRYYDRKEFEGVCVGYKKILCPGRGFLEREDIVKNFNKCIDEFMEENVENDSLLGVHCTNGVNRSGYLICRYLIDRCGWSSHAALEAFENSRKCPIERGAFVQALHRADRERRLRKRRNEANEESEEESERSADRRKKRRKRKEVVADEEMANLDPTIAAQMMKQIYQLEEQFKQAAEVAATGIPPVAEPAVSVYSNGMQSAPGITPPPYSTTSSARATATQQTLTGNISPESSPFIGSQNTGDNDDGDEDEEAGEIDYSMMGKVELRQLSVSQRRRERRQRLEKKFDVMKRGKFWQINEMLKESGT